MHLLCRGFDSYTYYIYKGFFEIKNTAKVFAFVLIIVLATSPSVIYGYLPDTTNNVTVLQEDIEPEVIEDRLVFELLVNQANLYPENFNIIKEVIGESDILNFLGWIVVTHGIDTCEMLVNKASQAPLTSKDLRDIAGFSAYALSDIYNKKTDHNSSNYLSNIIGPQKSPDGLITLGFVGDVSFADNWVIMPKYLERDKGIYGIVDERLVDIMSGMDIMCANNEFAFGTAGRPIPGKAFTFRSHPDRVSLWTDMGVDIVNLANNHVFDYGEEAFIETLQVLDKAGIHRIGAGRDLEEACTPIYFIINGYKLAYVAATRAEKNILTPEATGESPGVLRTYDPSVFIDLISQAKSNSDYVIVNVHWGAENKTYIEPEIYRQGRLFIDSGADLVIGHHAHVLQGIDSYKGKIIAYNLGNFIFNHYSVPTGIFQATIDQDGMLSYNFIPAYQKNRYVSLSTDREYDQVLDLLRVMSPGVDISKDGVITPLSK